MKRPDEIAVIAWTFLGCLFWIVVGIIVVLILLVI